MKRAMLRFFDWTNPVMIRILVSRVHWLLSSGLCVIEYEGRRSGRRVRLPTGCHGFDDGVVVSTSIAPERTWWRNFSDGHPARLCVKGEWREVEGRVLQPGTDEYRRWVEAIFLRGRIVSRAMGVDYDPDVGLTAEAEAFLARESAVTLFV